MQERGPGRRDVLRREPARGFVGIGAHLLHPAPTQHGPQQGGPRLGGPVIGSGHRAVLPAIDRVGPALRLGRPPDRRGDQRGPHGDHRMPLDSAPLIQPPEPPLEGGDPALPVGHQRQPSHQASNLIDVPGCDGVLQRGLDQLVAQAPRGGAAAQHRDQIRLQALQLREQHVAEQVVVAVPLSPSIQRDQQQVRPRQIRQRRRRARQLEHRITQRSTHPIQHRGPGQEHPLTLGDPGQELRLHIVAHQPIATAERAGRTGQRAAFPQVQRREVQPGRPPFGPLVQLRQVTVVQRHLSITQQQSRLRAGQRQITGADLGDPALGAQPRHPKRRLVPPRQRQPRPGRDVIGQHRQRRPARGVVQQVHVIEDQRNRRGHRRERRPQPWHHRAGHRTRRGPERVEHLPADRLHPVQRLRDIAEQHLRVIVPVIHRHPRNRRAVALGPLRQQRRFPIARRGDDRHDRTQVIPRQPIDQREPGHRPAPDHRTAQLRYDKVKRWPTRAVCRAARPLTHTAAMHGPDDPPRAVCPHALPGS